MYKFREITVIEFKWLTLSFRSELEINLFPFMFVETCKFAFARPRVV